MTVSQEPEVNEWISRWTLCI
uniref:Uncharacterized protein n=1 Tax=Arundo donax TaxID=35708 RepID=A0A0A9HT41_ARUDO